MTFRLCLDTVWQRHSEVGHCVTSTKYVPFIAEVGMLSPSTPVEACGVKTEGMSPD